MNSFTNIENIENLRIISFQKCSVQ